MRHAEDMVTPDLREAPAGHSWITVYLGHSIDEMMNPDAPVSDATAAALVRAADNRVVETWRRSPPCRNPFWIRNDGHIPKAQEVIDHGKLVFVSNPTAEEWVRRKWMESREDWV